MASLAWRRAKASVRTPGLLPMLVRHNITGNLPSSMSDPLKLGLGVGGKKPPRRWMSVADLVAEVDQAIVKGFQLHKSGRTYANMQKEAARLRADNDSLAEEVEELKEARREYVTYNLGDVKTDEAEAASVTRKVQEIDVQLAGLRSKHCANIKDVGALKLAMSQIEKTGDVLTLVDRVEESLNLGEVLGPDGTEAKAIADLIAEMQDEYDRTVPKIASYGKRRKDLFFELQALEKEVGTLGQTPQALDELRQKIIAKLLQDKRMMAQLDRLRQLQIMNSDLIGRLERAKTSLESFSTISNLIADGDAEKMKAKISKLDGDLACLRASTADIESHLDAHAEVGFSIVASLRTMKDKFTSDTGRLRERLFQNIHQEGQWKGRLAVLRGSKLQTLRFLSLMKSALPR